MKNTLLSDDKPLIEVKYDRLGYASFAKCLVDTVVNRGSHEGWVASIQGPWGAGKTTLLNFIEHSVESVDEDKRPIFIKFNPWWFSGQDELILLFLGTIISELEQSNLSKKIKKLFKSFTKLLGNLKISVAGVQLPLKDLISGEKDIAKLKNEVAKVLREQDKQIIVALDDIDRLSAEEIRQLFKTIKAIVDFPNVVYLLLFDRVVVETALSSVQGTQGRDYLDKIVQVPYQLPNPSKTALQQIFFEKMDEILQNTPEELFDQTHWGNVFYAGIDRMLTTPRKVVRLTNLLAATYPGVTGEVNPVDYVAICALQVFYPDIYELIRCYPDYFAGSWSLFGRDDIETVQSFHQEWLKLLVPSDERQCLQDLLQRLFPKLATVWKQNTYGSHGYSESGQRKRALVCHPDIFPCYFRLSISAGDVSRTEMLAVLELAKDQQSFSNALIRHSEYKRQDGTTRLRVVLERLEDYTSDELCQDVASNIVKSFLDVGDDLLMQDHNRVSMLDMAVDTRMGRVIYQLMSRKNNEDEVFSTFREGFLQGQSISMISREMMFLCRHHGKYGDESDNRSDRSDERLVSEEHMAQLEKTVLDRIRRAAEAEGVSLLKKPKALSLLYNWRHFGTVEEVKKWTDGIITDREGLIAFLTACQIDVRSIGLGNLVSKTRKKLDAKAIELFCTKDNLTMMCVENDDVELAQECMALLKPSSPNDEKIF